MLKVRSLALVVGSAIAVSGCAPALFMGGATTVATSAAEERGLGGVISDAELKARIMSLYAQSDLPLISQVDVVVRQGSALLTGTVDTPQIQLEAVRLAWLARGVKTVNDEIKVGKGGGVGSYAKDSWVSTQLKSKMLFDDKVSSINYNVHTVNGVAYIVGIAKSQQELDHVINLARNTSGVKKVVSYVHVTQPLNQGSAQPSNYHADPSYPAANGQYNAAPYQAPQPIQQEHLSGPNSTSAFE